MYSAVSGFDSRCDRYEKAEPAVFRLSFAVFRSGMTQKVNTAGRNSSKKYSSLSEYRQTVPMNFVNNSVSGICP